MIISFGSRAEHPRIATHRSLARLLSAVTLDGEPADRLVDELHVGHGLVVTELAQPEPFDPGPRPGDATRAA